MIVAGLAALATWLLVPVPATRRLKALQPTAGRERAAPSAVLLTTILLPIGSVLLLGPVVGLVVAVVATPVTRSMVAGMETAAARRELEVVERQLPAALDLVVAVLASGRPAVTAFEIVGEVTAAPLGPELTAVAARLSAGADPLAVWDDLARHRVLAPVGRALRRAEQSGTPVAGVVGGAAEEQRRARVSRARERARAVGVRTVAPLAACFLPAFFLVGIAPTLIGVASGLDLLAF